MGNGIEIPGDSSFGDAGSCQHHLSCSRQPGYLTKMGQKAARRKNSRHPRSKSAAPPWAASPRAAPPSSRGGHTGGQGAELKGGRLFFCRLIAGKTDMNIWCTAVVRKCSKFLAIFSPETKVPTYCSPNRSAEKRVNSVRL